MAPEEGSLTTSSEGPLATARTVRLGGLERTVFEATWDGRICEEKHGETVWTDATGTPLWTRASDCTRGGGRYRRRTGPSRRRLGGARYCFREFGRGAGSLGARPRTRPRDERPLGQLRRRAGRPNGRTRRDRRGVLRRLGEPRQRALRDVRRRYRPHPGRLGTIAIHPRARGGAGRSPPVSRRARLARRVLRLTPHPRRGSAVVATGRRVAQRRRERSRGRAPSREWLGASRRRRSSFAFSTVDSHAREARPRGSDRTSSSDGSPNPAEFCSLDA